MNFKSLYDEYHNKKLNCDITKNFKLNRVLLGSGGSINIVLDVTDKENNRLIIKVLPDIIYTNVKIKPDLSQLEIKFYQFLTKKYVLTDRTPHIVGMFNHQICPRVDKLLADIKPSKKKCPSYGDQLTKKLDLTRADYMICDLLLRHEMKLIGPTFDMILLEFCDDELTNLITWYMEGIRVYKGNKLKMIIDDFIYDLSRILFQIIFTLAIIKEDYPGFLHGDFFVRNILLSFHKNYQNNDYVAYHYKQKIFYLPANGHYAKINDFGLSMIVDELEPKTYEMEKHIHKYYHKNPFNEKTDIFNLLHDIYDGQNLGTMSINRLAQVMKMTAKKVKPVRNYLSMLLDVNVIDHINEINPGLLNQTWDIDEIDVLEDTVETPHKYLMGDYFSPYQTLPKNANVVRHYNNN